jgi:hypothetical protein
MATYQETLTNLRNWMDRDSTVVSDALLVDFLNYAADKAYRDLRIPALEATLDFTIDTGDVIANTSAASGTEVKMIAPSSFIELIYIQKKGTGIVWNQKVDSRTFHDRYADKKSTNYYTRIGSNFYLHGDLSVGDILEVHYYRRLAAINAVYSITPANYLGQTATLTTMTRRASGYTSPDAYLASLAPRTSLYFADGTSTADIDARNVTDVKAASETGFTVAAEMEPAYVPNWLRDENERILIYGALCEAFSYLEEPDKITLYDAKFNKEIESLNAEERRRIGTGGNTSISFSGMGLI